MTNINATNIRTKSGTEVMVVGKFNPADKKKRIYYGDKFVDDYDRDFTHREQREIGNVIFRIYKPKKGMKKNWTGCATFYEGKSAREYNPGYDRMGEVYISPGYRNRESTVCHELLHVKRYMRHQRHSDERKLDFEAAGRVTKNGLYGMNNGYYFYHGSYPKDADVNTQKMSHRQRGKFYSQALKHDRLLLTGSLSHRLIGKPIEKRVDTLFKKSAFFKKKFF